MANPSMGIIYENPVRRSPNTVFENPTNQTNYQEFQQRREKIDEV